MNIKDIKNNAPDRGDWLVNMFRRQWELELKYRPMEAEKGHFPTISDPVTQFPVDINSEHAQLLVKDGMERIIEELMEAANTLKNKPWKNTHVDTDEEHFVEELMDAMHFTLRLFLIVFGTPEDAAAAVYKLYFKKSEVNKFRQETNY